MKKKSRRYTLAPGSIPFIVLIVQEELSSVLTQGAEGQYAASTGKEALKEKQRS